MRQEHLVDAYVDVTLLGYFQGLPNGLGAVLEDLVHLRGRLVIELLGVKAHAVRLGNRGTGADAQKRVMHGRIVLIKVVAIVRRHERHAHLLGKLHELVVLPALIPQPMLHELEVIVFFSNKRLVLLDQLHRLLFGAV